MYTLHKSERISSKLLIDKMFEGGSKSFSIYPIRVVFMQVEKQEIPASILISVPKKRFKRAVKRNRIKRQIREAYRKNKYALLDVLNQYEFGIAMAFIYLSAEEFDSSVIEEKMKIALAKIGEKLE
ncbi:ribonuclease P protein component [Bacteroides sp. 519]|nr:ribonuclease P protein component [Bacteroides sp. 519]